MYYTAKEAADVLGLPVAVFRNLVSRKLLPQPKIIVDKNVWDKEEIDNERATIQWPTIS